MTGDQNKDLIKTSLGRSRNVNLKPNYNGEIFVCVPRDDKGAVWDAFSPQGFKAKHGNLEYKDLNHVLILKKDTHGNYFPSQLYDRSVLADLRQKAIDGKNGGKLSDEEGKKIFGRSRRIAETQLREDGVPIQFGPQKTKLEGEGRLFMTPGGFREHPFQYEQATPTGASAPDAFLHNNDHGVLVFRQQGDGLHSLEAMKQHFGYPEGALKSEGNIYHTEQYINSRSDWNTADQRFRNYLYEGHTKDLSEVMVGTEDGRIFGAQMLLDMFPDSTEARKLRFGPSKENDHVPINIKDHRGNTFLPIEEAQSSQHFQGVLQRLSAETGMRIYNGQWAQTKKDNPKELTAAATNAMFDRYRNRHNAWVQQGNVLYPLDDEKITATGDEFRKNFPPNKTFFATEGKDGGRNGSFRNMASVHLTSVPAAAMDELAARMAEVETPSRFVHAPTAIKSEAREEKPPVAPANVAAPPTVPVQWTNITPQSYEATTSRASQSRSDIQSRPSSRGSRSGPDITMN